MQTASESIPTTHMPAAYARRQTGRPRIARRWWIVGSVVVLGGLVLGLRSTAVGWLERLLGRESSTSTYHVVEPSTLQITLTEDGELRPRKSAEIKCEVEGQSTLLYVVEESTRVKQGDLLVELASDTLEEQLRSKQMELRRIQAEYEAAVAELEIQKNQNASDIKKAQIDLEVAELDLQKYLNGDFVGQLEGIELQIKQSNMEIEKQERELRDNEELAEKGWVTQNEIDERKFALDVARMQLQQHQLSKEILLNYERPKVEKQRRSAVDRAGEELEREEKRAESREKKSQARVDQYKDQLDNAVDDVERVQTQLEHCKLYAPADGIVQYPVGDRHRWGGGERIAAGERVYEGQTLVVLPDTSQMLVTTRIHEADRHLIREDLPCVVTVPAVPGETFTGTIAKIDKFADSENRWLNPDLKEHGAEILLDATDAPLSPGDSAEVKILIDTIENTLAVPVQCVFTRGPDSYVFVGSGGSAEPVKVTLGRSNTSMIEVTGGLDPGTRVVMHADEQMLAKLPAIDAPEHNEVFAQPERTERPQRPPQAEQRRRPPDAAGKRIARPKPAGGGEAATAKTGE
jgi:HlyD family secretion protein